MSKFYEVLIKREQYFHFPVIVEDGVEYDEVWCAIDNFDGLQSHLENECGNCETHVEAIRLNEGTKINLKADESVFQGFYSTRGLAVLTNKVEPDKMAGVATYDKELHGHLLKNEDTQTTA